MHGRVVQGVPQDCDDLSPTDALLGHATHAVRICACLGHYTVCTSYAANTEIVDMGAGLDQDYDDPTVHLRLLECWLPLAQQVSQDLGWGYKPAELEALILAAATDLVQTDSATTARAVLWRQHLRDRSTPR
jgi:hypothetical protein